MRVETDHGIVDMLVPGGFFERGDETMPAGIPFEARARHCDRNRSKAGVGESHQLGEIVANSIVHPSVQ